MGSNYDAIIIGAGMAGASSAFALAKRGLKVCVIESLAEFARKASGNRLALISPYLTTKRSNTETLYSAGYLFTLELLRYLNSPSPLLNNCGVLQFATTNRFSLLLRSGEELLGARGVQRLSPREADQVSGVSIGREALYVPDGGYLSPRSFVERLLSHFPSRVSLITGSRIASLTRAGQDWVALNESRVAISARIAVLCSAYEASTLEPANWLPLEPIRGQTVSISASHGTVGLRSVLSFGGYLTLADQGLHLLGAHYRHNDMDSEPNESENEIMVSKCAEWFPSFELNRAALSNARVCFRTSTVDRLPYIGALPDLKTMRDQARSFRSGTDLTKAVPNQTLPGVFVNLGHGSRGAISCPLGGEIIARLINGEDLNELAPALKVVTPERLTHRLPLLIRHN